MEQIFAKLTDPLILIALLIAFFVGRATEKTVGTAPNRNSASDDAEVAAKLDRVTLSKWLEIDAELDSRRKIAAIKLLRATTGLGLKDAKEAIDRRAAERDGR